MEKDLRRNSAQPIPSQPSHRSKACRKYENLEWPRSQPLGSWDVAKKTSQGTTLKKDIQELGFVFASGLPTFRFRMEPALILKANPLCLEVSNRTLYTPKICGNSFPALRAGVCTAGPTHALEWGQGRCWSRGLNLWFCLQPIFFDP